jgi:hypothetical protein
MPKGRWLLILVLSYSLTGLANLERVEAFHRKYFDFRPVSADHVPELVGKKGPRAILFSNGTGGYCEAVCELLHLDSAEPKILWVSSAKKIRPISLFSVFAMTSSSLAEEELPSESPEDALQSALKDFKLLFYSSVPITQEEIALIDLRRATASSQGQAGQRALLVASEESLRGVRLLVGDLTYVNSKRAYIQVDQGKNGREPIEIAPREIMAITLKPLSPSGKGMTHLSFRQARASFPRLGPLGCAITFISDQWKALWTRPAASSTGSSPRRR